MHTPTESTEPTKPTEKQPPPVTYADHWHRHLANITDANEGIARTRNAGMRLLRRLMAGRFEASNNQLAAAKFTTALKFIALPKLNSTRSNRCSAHSTPRARKPRNNSDTDSDFTTCANPANCVNCVNCINCDQCDHCADCEACDAAPPVPPEPPEPPKPIDPAEIPALIAEIKRINVDISDWTCQLGWDRENIELAKDPRVADFIRHQAENTEFKVLPGLRKELAAAEDRLAKSIAMRDALAAGATTEQAAAAAANATAANTSLTSATTNVTNSTTNATSTTNTTPTAATKPTTHSTTPDPLTTISAEAAFIDNANYKITQCRAIAARSTKPDEIDYYTKLADEIARDDLAPAQARLAAAQALLQPANPTHAATAPANATSATATVTSATNATTTAASATSSAQTASSTPAPAAATSSPAATPTTEPALPTDPAAIEREAAALKAEWQELDYARLDIHEELTTLERRKRHESHTPSWAAQAQDLINRCIAEKLNPTIWRQYHITQRLAQLGHKLE